jgi:N-acetylneuraminic acid mutarotase
MRTSRHHWASNALIVNLLALAWFALSAAAQTTTPNDWTWMAGSSTISCLYGNCPLNGVYGTLGTPAAGNNPGSRSPAASWTDKNGNFWLFGGAIPLLANFTGLECEAYLNDLWEFNPSTNEWAWMGGPDTFTVGHTNFQCGPSGIYGTLGVPAAGNVPGGRWNSVEWTDSNGNFWLFGGYGLDINGTLGYLNDLWMFNPSTNEWTWMGRKQQDDLRRNRVTMV